MANSTQGVGAASAAPIPAIPEGATLAEIDRAEEFVFAAIDGVQTPDEAEQLLRQVTAAEQAIRLARIGAEREQRWGGFRLRAERRYGELLGPPTDKGGRRTVSGTNSSDRFAQHQARKVAAVPQDKFDAYIEQAAKPSRTGLLRAAPTTARGRTRAKTITPPDAYDRLRKRAKDVRSLPSDQRPRWTETDVELVDTVLTHLLKRRPKYSGKRLRELASKRGNGNKLADVQYRMMQLTSILESIDIADYELTDPEEVGEFHDDLVELQVWTERSVAYASAKLDDAALERKIRKLRDPSGRPAAEQRTANALADKLERRRRESRLAS